MLLESWKIWVVLHFSTVRLFMHHHRWFNNNAIIIYHHRSQFVPYAYPLSPSQLFPPPPFSSAIPQLNSRLCHRNLPSTQTTPLHRRMRRFCWIQSSTLKEQFGRHSLLKIKEQDFERRKKTTSFRITASSSATEEKSLLAIRFLIFFCFSLFFLFLIRLYYYLEFSGFWGESVSCRCWAQERCSGFWNPGVIERIGAASWHCWIIGCWLYLPEVSKPLLVFLKVVLQLLKLQFTYWKKHRYYVVVASNYSLSFCCGENVASYGCIE